MLGLLVALWLGALVVTLTLFVGVVVAQGLARTVRSWRPERRPTVPGTEARTA